MKDLRIKTYELSPNQTLPAIENYLSYPMNTCFFLYPEEIASFPLT